MMVQAHYYLLLVAIQFNFFFFFTWSWCVSVRSEDEPILIEGDIPFDTEADRNADPCTSRGCKWGKWTDGKVYIPYYIASHFCKWDTDTWYSSTLHWMQLCWSLHTQSPLYLTMFTLKHLSTKFTEYKQLLNILEKISIYSIKCAKTPTSWCLIVYLMSPIA